MAIAKYVAKSSLDNSTYVYDVLSHFNLSPSKAKIFTLLQVKKASRYFITYVILYVFFSFFCSGLLIEFVLFLEVQFT